MVIATVASVTIGVVETYIAAMIGYILDLVLETEPNLLIADKWPLIATAAGFLLFVRPVSFLLSIYLQSVVEPRFANFGGYTSTSLDLGHPKSFFDNDLQVELLKRKFRRRML